MITRRIVNVWRAVVGARLTDLEAHHAEEMLDLEREQLQAQVFKYNQGLAGHAGLCERLKAELARLEKEQKQLEPKLRTRLEIGDRITAGQHALRLETIAKEIAQYREQHAQAETTYKELVRARQVAITAARDRIESLKRSIGDFRVQQALAELTELAAGMHGSIGVSDGTLERIQERVEEKRNFAAGRVRVARESIDTTELEAREAEQAAMAEAALQRFEAAGPPPATDVTPPAAAPPEEPPGSTPA